MIGGTPGTPLQKNAHSGLREVYNITAQLFLDLSLQHQAALIRIQNGRRGMVPRAKETVLYGGTSYEAASRFNIAGFE